jgi:hypothetical protein
MDSHFDSYVLPMDSDYDLDVRPMEPCCALCQGPVGSTYEDEMGGPMDNEIDAGIRWAMYARGKFLPDRMRQLNIPGSNEVPLPILEEEVKIASYWLHECRALYFDATTPGPIKVFISGPGCCNARGVFCVKDDDIEYYCYSAPYSFVVEPAFPFHEACYKVLTRNLGYEDAEDVDKDALYSAMLQCRNMKNGDSNDLDLDYGDDVEPNHFWDGDMCREVGA